MDTKSQVQRMNEIKLEAAEILLKQMKGLIEEPDLLVGTVQVSDAISKLHITPEPFDPSMFGQLMGTIAAPAPDKGEGGAVQ